jgi:hypothetical protein
VDPVASPFMANASKFAQRLLHQVDLQVLSPVHRRVHNVLLVLLILLQTHHSLSPGSVAPLRSEGHVKAVGLESVVHNSGIGTYS